MCRVEEAGGTLDLSEAVGGALRGGELATFNFQLSLRSSSCPLDTCDLDFNISIS